MSSDERETRIQMTTRANDALWNAVSKTDAKYTKKFNRGGGFAGTATNATWLARQATKQFGPIGIGWGVEVLDERYIEGKPGDIIHVIRIKLWYMLDGARGEIQHYGQTQFVGTNKNGAYTDEEAPKKSLTDATSKCLSLLGFASDIHLGMYDDNKYVMDRQQEAGASDRVVPSHSPEDQARAEAQAVGKPTRDEAKIDADALIAEFTSFTHVDEVIPWIEKHIAAWDVSDKRQRPRVYKQCETHVRQGLVEGLSETGFREAWGHSLKIARGELATQTQEPTS